MNSLYKIFYFHTVKWFQVLLFSINNSIEQYSLICPELNGSQHSYVIPTIQPLHIIQ